MLGIFVALAIFANTQRGDLWSLIDQGKYAEVLKITETLIDSGKVDKDILLARAFAFRMVDSLKKAIGIYNEILKVDPDDYDALLGLALTLSWDDQLDSSISVYKHIITLYGNDKDALMGIAQVYGWKGDLKNARKWIEVALEFFKDPEVYKLCGEIYTWSDMYDRAIECFKKALDLSPNDPELMVKIGNIYEWKSDYRDAVMWYKKALEKDPSNAEAQKGIARVRSLLSPLLSLKITPAVEKDSLSTINHFNIVLSSRKYINKFLDLSLRFGFHRTGFESDSSRQVYLIQPGIVFKLFPFTLTVSPGFGATGVFYSSILYKRGFLNGELIYAEEILEEGNMIKLRHLELRGKFDIAGFSIKAGLDQGTIPFDDNNRKIFDLTVTKSVLKRPFNGKVLYSYGYKKYDRWSPFYYSPQDFNLHSIGVILFKDFEKFYVYFDASRSVSGKPETTTFSLEAGAGKVYASFSSFVTSENYSYKQFTLGFTTRIK